MKVNRESNGQFFFKGAGISYTVIFNSGGGEYAQSSHYHASYELQCPITDGWTIIDERSKLKAEAGSVFFIPPHTPHHFIPQPNTHDQKKISIKFSLLSTQKSGHETVDRISTILNTQNGVSVLFGKELPDLFSILSELSEEEYVTDQLITNLVQTIILYIVNHLEKNCDKSDNKGFTPSITDADHKYAILIEDCIAENYKNSNFSLSSLAKRISLSERQSERLCKKIFHVSFNRLLTRHRMMIARSLITDNALSLAEIASCVGFNSYAGFYKRYKEHFGHSPKQDTNGR